MTNLSLPADLVARSATHADAQALVDLNVESELADVGVSETTIADVLEFWKNEHFNLETNTCLVSTLAGEIVGYVGVVPSKREVVLDVHTGVRLGYRKSGLEDALLQWAEERARELFAETQPIPHIISAWSNTPYTSHMLAARGYQIESSDYRMEIVMHETPPEAEALAGVTIRPFQAGQEEQAVYKVVAEAFPDIDGRPYRPYKEWYTRIFEQSISFEPEMLYVAEAEGEIVGVTICRTHLEEHSGYVWQVAVLRTWRRRGIALQLLRTAFAEYYRRGMNNVQLSVNIDNQTGALQLYDHAGMHKHSQIDRMHKEL